MAGRKRRTVRELATEAGCDLDEALVLLWDAGFDYVDDPASYVPKSDLARAQSALGVATRRELRTRAYWRELLDLDDSGLDELLESIGLLPLRDSDNVPRGAISRLKKEARRRQLDPLTETSQVQAMPATTPPRHEIVWSPPGHVRNLRYLVAEEIEAIHWALAEDFAQAADPISPPGVRDQNLLASAVFRAQTSSGEKLKYPSVESAAAALLHSLVLNHAFHNGNKRTALVSMVVFLDENGLFLESTEGELFKLVLQVAQHRIPGTNGDIRADNEVLVLAHWVCDHTRLTERGDRLVPWRRLRRILTAYGCDLQMARGVGNRLNITRQVTERRPFGRTRQRQISTQVFYSDDGRDAEVETVKKIRLDLQLDDQHGIDSFAFYAKEPMRAEDFIARYRKTLARLAKL
ncbi:MAG: type II toxin-antitoxin system death-on-curing family toxin [Actinomycetota bacterium]